MLYKIITIVTLINLSVDYGLCEKLSVVYKTQMYTKDNTEELTDNASRKIEAILDWNYEKGVIEIKLDKMSIEIKDGNNILKSDSRAIDAAEELNKMKDIKSKLIIQGSTGKYFIDDKVITFSTWEDCRKQLFTGFNKNTFKLYQLLPLDLLFSKIPIIKKNNSNTGIKRGAKVRSYFRNKVNAETTFDSKEIASDIVCYDEKGGSLLFTSNKTRERAKKDILLTWSVFININKSNEALNEVNEFRFYKGGSAAINRVSYRIEKLNIKRLGAPTSR